MYMYTSLVFLNLTSKRIAACRNWTEPGSMKSFYVWSGYMYSEIYKKSVVISKLCKVYTYMYM